MLDRRWLVLLVLLLPLAGVCSQNLRGQDFKAQDKAFREIVADERADATARIEAVNAVSELGTGASVASLLFGVAAIDVKLESRYEERTAYSEEYQEYETFELTNAQRKEKEVLEEKMELVEARVMDHEAVLVVLFRELRGQSTPAAQKELGGSRSMRAGNWRARGYAASAAAAMKDVPVAGPLKLLKDSDPRVRALVAEGFGLRKDPSVISALGKVLVKDKAWQVRATIVKAFDVIGSIKATRFLIEALGKESGRLLEDTNAVLKAITGQNFDPDYRAWMGWYEKNKEKIEGGGQVKGPKKLPRWKRRDGAEVYGLKTYSKRMLLLLDISDSMNSELGNPGAVTGDEEAERWVGKKIDVAKKELKRVIRAFEPDSYFNIIAFNQLVQPWKPKMMKASQANKNEAYVWVRKLEAETSTYLYGALKKAFETAGMGATDPNYAPALDTILLLSDGAPTDNTMAAKHMDPEKILKAVRAWNKLSKITIHVLAIDEEAHGDRGIRFLKSLARENNGTYRSR